MDPIASGKKALRCAETELRRHIQQATDNGDYESVATLAEWAGAIRAIGRYYAETESGTPTSAEFPSGKKTHRPAKARRRRGKKSTVLRSDYPKFECSENQLVKIAWSRSQKKEYQHKAPRYVLDCLVSRIVDLDEAKNVFTMGALLPLSDVEHGEIPDYQAYLCLAWLVSEGLVEKHGRKGYSVAADNDLLQQMSDNWEQTATSSAR